MTKADYNPYEELANAIVALAVSDYRKTLWALKRNPRSQTAKDTKASLLRFFRSEWFKCLTNVDGEYLIDRLNREVNQ